jgi:osmotically inducible lipoprotein OsmB
MKTFGKFSRLAAGAAISAALMLPATASLADPGRNTVIGAGAGALAGGLLTHGSAGGIVGGAVVGGLAGHALSHHHHHHHRRYCGDRYC